MIDFLHQHLAEGSASLRPKAAFVELLGESSQSPGWGLRHLADATANVRTSPVRHSSTDEPLARRHDPPQGLSDTA
jgi:hypothetical protein